MSVRREVCEGLELVVGVPVRSSIALVVAQARIFRSPGKSVSPSWIVEFEIGVVSSSWGAVVEGGWMDWKAEAPGSPMRVRFLLGDVLGLELLLTLLSRRRAGDVTGIGFATGSRKLDRQEGR